MKRTRTPSKRAIKSSGTRKTTNQKARPTMWLEVGCGVELSDIARPKEAGREPMALSRFTLLPSRRVRHLILILRLQHLLQQGLIDLALKLGPNLTSRCAPNVHFVC